MIQSSLEWPQFNGDLTQLRSARYKASIYPKKNLPFIGGKLKLPPLLPQLEDLWASCLHLTELSCRSRQSSPLRSPLDIHARLADINLHGLENPSSLPSSSP